MKKIILILFCSFLVLSCSQDETGNVSKITYYPDVSINGNSFIVLNQGDPYTDQGALAFAGTEALDVTTTGSVNPSTTGVYKITYSAVNVDGFSASKTRTVIVISTAPSNINLSGTWYRNGNANNITQISDRVYQTDNATGYTTGNLNNLVMTFYNLDDVKLYAPYKENASATGISAESNVGTIVNNNSFNWVIYASGFFGTSTRNFTRP